MDYCSFQVKELVLKNSYDNLCIQHIAYPQITDDNW